jgi:ABC-type Zn uptake system ZnuABC Zn-binding protein ZnuA
VDPHGYELRPGDVKALRDASLVVRSGGDLDEWLSDAIDSSGTDAEVLTLIDAVEPLRSGEEEAEHHEAPTAGHDAEHEETHGDQIDPHWWQDPRNAERAVTAIERTLASVDRDAAMPYAARAARYKARVEALDAAVAACWTRVPASQRKIVTTHDALAYYARRYDVEVIGTVIPSLSTQGQPSAGDLAQLVATIRREDAAVIFAESSLDSKVERAIAEEAGVELGGTLWADSLGPPDSDGATYLASIASNTEAMIDGVTQGNVDCTLPSSARPS